MAAVDHEDRETRQVTLALAPSTGCEDCGDTGVVTGGELDAEGVWFKDEPCASCNGTGIAHCAAEGCSWPARLIVRLGPSRWLHCCGDHAHGHELIRRLLDGWL